MVYALRQWRSDSDESRERIRVMGKFFDMDSPVMRTLNKVADLMWLNILTLVCCLPVITAGASITAMHYVLLKMVRNEESYITKAFLKSFKDNFKQSTLIWLMMMAVMAILGMDYWILRNSAAFPKALVVVIGAVSIFLYMFSLYIFPLQSKFANTIRGTIKNAALMSILGFPRTIGMTAATFIPLLLLYLFDIKVVPIVIMFGFTGPGYLCAMLYNGLFKRFEPEEKKESEEDEMNAAISSLDAEKPEDAHEGNQEQ